MQTPLIFCFFQDSFIMEMPKKMKLRIKIGTDCEAPLNYTHLNNLVNGILLNATVNNVIKYILVILQDKRVVKGKYQLCIVISHLQFKNSDIYCFNCWSKMKQQGSYDHLYQEEYNLAVTKPVDSQHKRISRYGPPPDEREIDEGVICSRNQTEDISQIFQQGYVINNNNDCLPNNDSYLRREDLWVGNDVNASGQTWMWGRIDHLSRLDVTYNRARLNRFSGKMLISELIVQMLFAPLTPSLVML